MIKNKKMGNNNKRNKSGRNNMEKTFLLQKDNRKAYCKKTQGITLIALVVTILFSYDEKLKFSNSKGFLLQTI